VGGGGVGGGPPHPNPQTPNPQSPIPNYFYKFGNNLSKKFKFIYLSI